MDQRVWVTYWEIYKLWDWSLIVIFISHCYIFHEIAATYSVNLSRHSVMIQFLFVNYAIYAYIQLNGIKINHKNIYVKFLFSSGWIIIKLGSLRRIHFNEFITSVHYRSHASTFWIEIWAMNSSWDICRSSLCFVLVEYMYLSMNWTFWTLKISSNSDSANYLSPVWIFLI